MAFLEKYTFSSFSVTKTYSYLHWAVEAVAASALTAAVAPEEVQGTSHAGLVSPTLGDAAAPVAASGSLALLSHCLYSGTIENYNELRMGLLHTYSIIHSKITLSVNCCNEANEIWYEETSVTEERHRLLFPRELTCIRAVTYLYNTRVPLLLTVNAEYYLSNFHVYFNVPKI